MIFGILAKILIDFSKDEENLTVRHNNIII